MDQAWRANLSNAENAAALRAADGLTNREIAAEMHVSRHTVDFYLRRVYRKLNIHSRVQLARLIAERETQSRLQ
jgi:DNA-binding CsgD family transcriptional regulator